MVEEAFSSVVLPGHTLGEPSMAISNSTIWYSTSTGSLGQASGAVATTLAFPLLLSSPYITAGFTVLSLPSTVHVNVAFSLCFVLAVSLIMSQRVSATTSTTIGFPITTVKLSMASHPCTNSTKKVTSSFGANETEVPSALGVNAVVAGLAVHLKSLPASLV